MAFPPVNRATPPLVTEAGPGTGRTDSPERVPLQTHANTPSFDFPASQRDVWTAGPSSKVARPHPRSRSQSQSESQPQPQPQPQQAPALRPTESALQRRRSNSIELHQQQAQARQSQRQERHLPQDRRTPESLMPTPIESRDAQFPSQPASNQSWYSQQAREHDSSQSPVDDDQIGDSSRLDDQLSQQTSPSSLKRDLSTAFGTPGQEDDRRDSASVQSDLKKRKRNFSNRTKTGCLTCRKRKKKCDECKPECSNCIRGGFICQGYPPQRGTPGWQKPDSKIPAVPLESKDPSYVPPGAYGMPLPQAVPQRPGHPSHAHAYAAPTPGMAPSKREPLPPYRGHPLRIDPPTSRILSEDDRPTASTLPSAITTSPDIKMSALSAYTQSTTSVFPTPVSAVSAHTTAPPPFSKDYQRIPPLHDTSRTEPETPRPASTTEPLPRINVLRPSRTTSPIVQLVQPQPPKSVQDVPPMAPQAMADPRSAYPPEPPRPRSAKDDMLSGRIFSPFDKELSWEKDRCASAVWRFNNCMNPAFGVSIHEKMRLFREIVFPRDPSPFPSATISQSRGFLGDHVAVDAPFACEFGYNLFIGRNVLIGRNCTIIDTGEVRIGDNCRVGPNVSLFTSTHPEDPKLRRDMSCPTMAQGITIQDDCFIGGGVTILAGRTIGRGSIVGAGSIVTKDVPPYTVVAGNPAKVIRGVNTHGED